MSAAASMDNFDENVGYKVALMSASADARKKLWQLEGYKLIRETPERSEIFLPEKSRKKHINEQGKS